jgi:hypothetical protein
MLVPKKRRYKRNVPIMGLIHRQEVWVLTVQGWLVVLGCFATLIIFLLTHVHSFLAFNSPIKADVLVVEGWIPDYAIEKAIIEFKSGGYQKLITTGVPMELGFYLAQYKNAAEVSAATLKRLGFEQDKLVAVPAPQVIRNRTYASANALRKWLASSDLKIKSINLYTFDVHTRRSWLIFKEALAPEIEVGAIAVSSYDYNPNQWWISSEGVRSIISEMIAYIYARFINWKA